MTAAVASPQLKEALRLAQLSVPTVPGWPLDTERRCTCTLGPECPKPGKHPWTKHGDNDATTAEPGLSAWFAFRPESAVLMNLEKADLLDIAPDSPEWLAKFERRGLPPTAVYQSGGGEGHRHYLYRRPKDCPIARLCVPDQYDIMSKGLAAAPPSLHASGRHYVWITPLTSLDALPEAPAWAVQMLHERATRNAATPAAAGDDDEPPVRLDGDALRRWRGELVETKPDGDVDRSASLFHIGLVLARGNASGRAIAAALEERDATLGWDKYSDRRDDREYERIATKALVGQTVTYARPIAGSSIDADVQDESRPLDCGHQSTIDGLRATIREMLNAFGNEHLRAAEKATWIKAAFRVHERDSHGESSLPGARPPSKRITIAGEYGLANELGLSAQTVGRHLRLGEQEDAPLIRHAEGVITTEGWRTLVEIEARHATLPETLRAIATYTPPERPTHGGKRVWRCPSGCQAKVREYSRWVCTGCGEVYEDPRPIEHAPATEAGRADVQDEGCPLEEAATRDEGNTVASPTGYQDESRPLAAAAHNQSEDLGNDGGAVCPEPSPVHVQDEQRDDGWADGYCTRHGRWLTYSEATAGECSSCSPLSAPSNGHAPPAEATAWLFGAAS